MSVMKEVMKGVRVHAVGGPAQLTYEENVPSPAAPGAGEVLGECVKIRVERE